MPSEIRNHLPLSSPRNEPQQDADRLVPGGAVTPATAHARQPPGHRLAHAELRSALIRFRAVILSAPLRCAAP